MNKVWEDFPAPLHSSDKVTFNRCDGSEHKNICRFLSNGFGDTCGLFRGINCIVLKKQSILDLLKSRQQQERENATFFLTLSKNCPKKHS